ncbi:polyketide synthase [Aporhodopirellula aestuarii]|uniref:Polyketide synthase n=1 Tax=Aporhodopirellula aestuarii TaxID=2950107 RepID=A0ABT0TXM5_9BACT|nr:polyketide synthase [Aporhodopirellula aestuarii]MCM2369334.1 polyketide synthase [Aporhodopirellula aestuarii]
MPQSSSHHLPRSVESLLSRLRQQVRRYIVWDSVLALSAALLAVFWIAFLIDYLPVRVGGSEMPRSARGVVLIATLVLVLVLFWRFLVSRMSRELPDDSLALLIERHHPEIGGRFVTAVQLGDPSRKGDSYSPTFLKQVQREAERQVDGVDLDRVFRPEPIRQKLSIVIPLLLAAVAMAIASPQTFGRAVGRLTLLSDSPWPRNAALEMVGVEVPIIAASQADDGATELVKFENGVVQLARGSNATLRIRAAGEEFGHEIPDLCTVSYVDDEGNRGQSNLRRVGRVIDGYQSFVLDGPPLTSLAKSVTLSIRGLDDRLSGYRIEAVDPPAIAQMQMKVRYPDYLRVFSNGQEFDQQLDYQAGVRIREGSSLTLVGKTSSPLGAVDIVASDARSGGSAGTTAGTGETDRELLATIAEDAMSFTISLDDVRDATSIRIVPRDDDGISAQAAYRYFIGVVRDEAPETTMRLSGIGSSITPIAMLPIEATAKDDYGIESMSITMTVRQQATENPLAEVTPSQGTPDGSGGADEQNYTVSPELDRQGAVSLTIDLRELADESVLTPIAPGATVTLNTQAQDRFDLGSSHITQGELVRLQVVTPEELLATLERRELEFRSRLEQAIDETRRLRQSLTAIEGEATDLMASATTGDSNDQSGDGDTDNTATDDADIEGGDAASESAGTSDQENFRSRQRVQLRIRQAELQAAKTTDELAGIVAGLDDLLLEMVNNRIDSVDRRERLEEGVRTPLADVVEEPFPNLRRQIVELERILMSSAPPEQAGSSGETSAEQMRTAVQTAVTTNEEILLQLSAVLEKMLDLESFNEILDLMRGLIQDQENLLEETEEEQKKRVLDLFK